MESCSLWTILSVKSEDFPLLQTMLNYVKRFEVLFDIRNCLFVNTKVVSNCIAHKHLFSLLVICLLFVLWDYTSLTVRICALLNRRRLLRNGIYKLRYN